MKQELQQLLKELKEITSSVNDGSLDKSITNSIALISTVKRIENIIAEN